MHGLAAFAKDDVRRCLKNRLVGASFGSKTP
jgi:hypothetical protein